MSHLDNHPHAFLNNQDIVINIFNFQSHDSILLDQVKEQIKADSYISCCEYGLAYINGDFYNNKFYLPKPFPSWIRNEDLGIWEAPIAMPENIPHKYIWNESEISWSLAPIPSKPFESWTFDSDLYVWEAPIPYPDFDEENPKYYEWNEDILNWEEIQVSE